MEPPAALKGATRCHAHSKRTGEPCRSPAVAGWKVCRMHGAGGGAPKGSRNNYKHGYYSAEQRRIRALIRATRHMLADEFDL